MAETYHIPALLTPAIEGLDIRPDGIYVDATFGGGGHSRAIVEHLETRGHLYGFDQDEDAVNRAFSDERFTIVHSNFRYLSNFMRYYGVTEVDGILADLGVSFPHFDDAERGFSFRWNGILDMRMNRRATRSAAWILANYTEEQLTRIFRLYGDLKQAGRIARAVVKVRETTPVDTVEQLLATVRPLINPRQEKKEMAQVFQALRMEVNDETEALRRLLEQSLKVLRPGGRLVVITYHSIEDRMVKNFMKTGNIDGIAEKDFYGHSLSPMKLINAKPIVPDEREIEANPRSRSAKLRIARKI